jgi:hypothetical protein
MTAARRTPSQRRSLRPIGPAVAELLDTLRPTSDGPIDITLSARTAAAIARLDARRTGTLTDRRTHPAHAAATTIVAVDRPTLERWTTLAWQAVGEGLLAPPDAQALSDLLEPRGAA